MPDLRLRANLLAEFIPPPTLSVECVDYAELLAAYPTAAAYLDPPYLGRRFHNLYGRYSEFNHDALAELLRQRNSPWLLSYNDCPEVKRLYKGYRMKRLHLRYRMAHDHYATSYTGQGELLIKGA